MPTSVARNAAQIIIVPSFKNRVPIHIQSQTQSAGSVITPLDGMVLLPWISNTSQNANWTGGPIFPTQTFVSQASGNAPLVFTGPGYVNFYLIAPESSAANGNSFLRIIGIVFKTAQIQGMATPYTNQALNNMPVSEISLISAGDPVLENLNMAASNYYLSNKNTDPLSTISPAVWTPPAANSPIGTAPVTPFRTSTGIQVYNAFTNPAGAAKWNPAWDFYIAFQWGDGTVSLLDPDEENEPPVTSDSGHRTA
jgi:hypothetical protein